MAIINRSRPKLPPNNVDFNPLRQPLNISVKDLNSLIYNQGVKIKLYKTIPCPNRKSVDSGEHQINCPVCKNIELLDVDPVETYALVEAPSSQMQWDTDNVRGVWIEQNSQITFLSHTEVFYFTKIELMDYTMLFYEVIPRQEGLVDVLKYPVLSVNVLVDQNGVRYYQGNDFEIVSQNLQWKMDSTARRPATGLIYSIHYNTYVTFRALYSNRASRFGTDGFKKPVIENVEYNQSWICRRDYLISRTDSQGNSLTEKLFPPG
jgi:hypothetical protein